jgi:hypothetical protein
LKNFRAVARPRRPYSFQHWQTAEKQHFFIVLRTSAQQFHACRQKVWLSQNQQ